MKVSLDYNENTCKGMISISNEDMDVYNRLRAAFSTPNKGKKFVKGPAKHWVSDNIYFITPIGAFNFGLRESIVQWIKDNVKDRTIDWELSEAFKTRFKTDDNIQYREKLKLALRDYQKDCVLRALKYRFGTFVMGTGAGKTLTIATILDNLFHFKKIKRALILVPDNGLVTQFYDELYHQYGMKQKITLFYDKFDKVSKNDKLIIANRPLFLSRWEQYKKFWKTEIDCLVIDEAHSLKHSNEVSKCIEKIPCIYKFGFTGTLAPAKEDRYRTLGLLGPVRYEKVSKELRDEGYLSDVKVRYIQLNYAQKIKYMPFLEEQATLEQSELRNTFLTKLVFQLSKNTLLLVNHIHHGLLLASLFQAHNTNKTKRIYFIQGEVDTSIRDNIKKLMEVEDNIICIAITKIFSTGINIKNLHNIILCAGGKSSITVVQSIGRGLRLHPNKKELNIFDITDLGYKYSCKHGDERKKIYEQEQIVIKPYTISLQ